MTRLGTALVLVLALATFAVAGTSAVGAQIRLPLGNNTTTTTAPGAPPPPPPKLLPNPLAPPPAPAPKAPPPAPGPKPAAAPPPAPALGGDADGVVPPDAGPFPAHLAALSRSVKRTRPNNSRALVDALRALEALGVPHDEAMRIGMGRFPIAGYAHYSHDWWFPRFGPGWRLHQGTDLFADMGTPVRSPTDGVVRLTDGGLGGISTYVIQADGTYFYMTHLAGRPPGLREGQAVRTGDIVGYVGNSGNAAGGPPHVHFEIHPAYKVVTKGRGKKATTRIVPLRVAPGTPLPAVDPKSWLDGALDEAMKNVGPLVDTFKGRAQAGPLPGAAGVVAPPVPGLLGPVAPGDLPLATARSVFIEQPMTATPLAAVAFLLVVIMGALTPVLVPRYALPSMRTNPWRLPRRKAKGERSPKPERRRAAKRRAEKAAAGEAAKSTAEE
ncbi:MAG: M23 family metallopeptidase, partial [Actinomycetota bacterium]|nr:M23 family metallopeptidase [Actinomycetota bacterium]